MPRHASESDCMIVYVSSLPSLLLPDDHSDILLLLFPNSPAYWHEISCSIINLHVANAID